MSQANVDLVRSLQPPPHLDLVALFRSEAGAAQLRNALAPFVHDDFSADIPGTQIGERTGLEGLTAVWLDWLEPWETYRTEIEDVVDAGDDVLVLVRDYGRRPGMTAEVPVQTAAVWTVRDGKVAAARFFINRAEAFEAAGLPRSRS